MNLVLKEIYEKKSVQDSQGNLINPFPTATSIEIGTFFREFIQENNLRSTLEIGMAYGLSSMFICQTHDDRGYGSHIAIDPFQSSQWKSIGLLNIEKASLSDKLRFFEGYSYEVLPKLLAQKETIDFAFIDGSHQFDYTLVDFFYIDKLLQIGGYVIFDDIWMPGVRKVLYFVLRNRMYELVKINVASTLKQRITRFTRRFLQNPLEKDYYGIKYLPDNICVLKKVAEETDENRPWDLHRSF